MSWPGQGTSAFFAVNLLVSLFLSSSASNAVDKLRALEGCYVSSKNPLKVRHGGVAGRNGIKHFHDEGVIAARQINNSLLVLPSYDLIACDLPGVECTNL